VKFSASIASSFGLLVSLTVACSGDVSGLDFVDGGLEPDATPTPPMDRPDADTGPVMPPPPPPLPAILFVVGQTNLGPADAAARQRMEGLGFTVVLRTGVDVKAADATGRQLVVISSSVQSGDVGGRLRDVDVPVLVWEPALFDDMLMTGTVDDKDFGSKDDQLKINIKLPGHPIASGLSAGPVQVVTVKDRFSWGKPLPSADVVATLDGFVPHCGCPADQQATIFAYEKGDQLLGGVRAKARRLGMFLNNDTAVRFNATGWKVFDSAVRWTADVPACVAVKWFADVDSDGFGNDANSQLSCTRPTTGGFDWVTLNGDCNDLVDSIHPGAPEICDGIDQDCNALIDEQPTNGFEYYLDSDFDGFGDATNPVRVCATTPPPGTVLNDDDCNDSNAAIHPGAPEIPGNSIDENCDGLAP